MANDTFTGAFSTVQRTAKELPGNIQSAAAVMPSRQALATFGVLVAAGAFFISLAFAVFLPFLVLAPQKFALSFTLGCALVMASFFALKGPMVQLRHMTAPDRLPYTVFFVLSMAATITASVVYHNYVLSVAASGLQVTALLYYVVSYFPGGSAGIRFLTSTASSTLVACFSGR
eukprot:SM000090S24320  [mRNA]  locus=s90:236080:236829:- [translate_table: standard]